MSQFYGYTVDLVFREPAGKTVRGIIEKIADKEIVLKNPVLVLPNGSYEKVNKKELQIQTQEISDLNVVKLAQSNSKYIKKQMKLLKGKDKNKDGKDGKDGKLGTPDGKKAKKLADTSITSTNGSFSSDSELNAASNSGSSSGSGVKKDLDVKYVDIYNQKPTVTKPKKVNQLEEFDFASNLQKFDKESVFKNISKHDKIDQSSRLVSFNKVENKDKYGSDEMILKQKQNSDWDNNDNFDYSHIMKSSVGDNGSTTNKNSDSNISEAGDSASISSYLNSLQGRHASNTSFERKASLTPTFAQFFSSMYDESPIPTCSTLQLSNVLSACKEKFGLTDQILNENAGRSISQLIITNIIGSFRIGFKNHNEPPTVLLLVGNNRSGSIAVNTGRHLFNRGLKTIVFLLYDKNQSDEDLLTEVDDELKRYSDIGGKIVNSPAQLEKILKTAESPLEFVLDGLQGFDSDINDLLDAELEQVTQLIEWCNESGLPMMSLDIPTGLSASSGTNENDNTLLIKSKYLVSVGLPLSSALNMYKFGYFEKGNIMHYLADCGIPRRVFGSKASLRKFDRRWFADSDTIELKVV